MRWPKEERKFSNADVNHHADDKKHSNAKLIDLRWNIHMLSYGYGVNMAELDKGIFLKS